MLSLTNSFMDIKGGDEVKIYTGCFIPDNRLLLNQFQERKLFVCNIDGSNPKAINLNYDSQRITLYDNDHALVSVGLGGIQIIDLTTLKPGRIVKV